MSAILERIRYRAVLLVYDVTISSTVNVLPAVIDSLTDAPMLPHTKSLVDP